MSFLLLILFVLFFYSFKPTEVDLRYFHYEYQIDTRVLYYLGLRSASVWTSSHSVLGM